jgi:hypothetical protein
VDDHRPSIPTQVFLLYLFLSKEVGEGWRLGEGGEETKAELVQPAWGSPNFGGGDFELGFKLG